MTGNESFEEWQARTAPPDEAIARATSTTLPIFPTGVLTRRWLRAGATMDEPRFVKLGWVRLVLFVLLLVAVSIGNTREMVLVVTLGIVAAAELRWHLLESAGRRLGLVRGA